MKPLTMLINITPAKAQAIAREAFTYGFPLVEGYKTLFKQAVDDTDPNFKAPFNQIGHSRSVATPEDTGFITPNSDTPYSYAWLDLRAEPIVISMPPIEDGRYYSAQLIDLQTFNFDYLGTRICGNAGGNYLIAGPDWQGEKPASIDKLIRCESQLFYALFRTQLLNPTDIGLVNAIQDGYKVQSLSRYLEQAGPGSAEPITWPKPTEVMTTDQTLFPFLNFLLGFIPTHPTEVELMARFAELGIGAGQTFNWNGFTSDVQNAILAGIAQVWEVDFAGCMAKISSGELTSGDCFGTREFLKNDYLRRFTGAKLGIYGNSKEEALYPSYFSDANGNEFNASTQRYTLRFEKDHLPPASAFWSVTMYDGKSQFLVANELNRYLLNSTMLDQFVYADDGSLTLYLQKDSPGAAKQANWLPAPDGKFYAIMRLYIPETVALTGTWTPPPIYINKESTCVDTRIGPLEFDRGLPTLQSVTKLFDEMDFQRACQAYIWALPLINIGEWQLQQKAVFGAKDGDIVIYNDYDAKLGVLTPNLTTPYIIGFANLATTGPLVIDYPAGKSAGGVLDFWQRPLFDMGETGPDLGKGGKYLVLGPDQTVTAEQAGEYTVYTSPTINIGIGYRVLEKDPETSDALMHGVKVYPLASPGSINCFLTPDGRPWSQTPPSGMRYWERLAYWLENEPVAERDLFFMAMLKPLGIAPGKPFNPDARQKAILEDAAFIGEQMAKVNSFDKRFPGSRYRDDAQWESLFAPGFRPDQAGSGYGQMDERAAYTWEAVWTTSGMVTTTPGVGQAYLGVHRDQNGKAFDGAKTYRLVVPPNPPFVDGQFWSVTIYDLETRRPVENGLKVVDCSSRQELFIKADGSVEIFFGPANVKGLNTLITVPDRAWFPLLRLYGPTQAYFDATWPLPDITEVN